MIHGNRELIRLYKGKARKVFEKVQQAHRIAYNHGMIDLSDHALNEYRSRSDEECPPSAEDIQFMGNWLYELIALSFLEN